MEYIPQLTLSTTFPHIIRKTITTHIMYETLDSSSNGFRRGRNYEICRLAMFERF